MFEQLSARFKASFKTLSGKGRLSEANIATALREVRIALLEADVALDVVREFIEQVKVEALGKKVLDSLSPAQAVIKVVQHALTELLGSENAALNLRGRPAVILLAGLQGVGKTTTVGKLAKWIQQHGSHKVLVVSTDVSRPAAIAQLQRLAAEVDVAFFASHAEQSPLDIARGALDYARQQGFDVLLVDTAGRLHIDHDMMREVQHLHTALKPVETLFVADSMTGQDAANSARAFDQALPLSGVILTKTDGDARGGAALSIRKLTAKPIKFIGVGESPDALQAFHPARVAARILGMGDVLSLLEEAEQKVDKQQAQKLAAKLTKGKGFDLEDFREQMLQLEKMGGMMGLMQKLPTSQQLPPAALAQFDAQKSKQVIAMINSMTPHERRFPAVLRGSRKKRIAHGSGTQVQDVNRLLKQFMQMQKMMRRMGKSGKPGKQGKQGLQPPPGAGFMPPFF